MSFALHRPETVAEAVAAARHLAPHARFIAGGTDLIIQINRKRVEVLSR
jgi:aerobic carbon-monoxide dehydrogenase medium subunit